MRKLSLTILFCFGSLSLMSQSRNNYWAFGYSSFGPFPDQGGTAMDFWGGVRNVFDHARELDLDFTNASICDTAGNLVMYTNGVYIANAEDDTMVNGSGLNPSWYTTMFNSNGLRIPQANLFLPKPGSDTLYYLFHETLDYGSAADYATEYLYQSIINMNGDSGKGEVILKNKIILQDDTLVSGSLAACKHANGRDWWLAVPEYANELGLYLYLITPDTIALESYQKMNANGITGGQACFSPDGSKYIINTWSGNAFYDFDRCSGTFIYLDSVLFTDGVYWMGASISPNSRYCYLSHGDSILQYDLQAPDISFSAQVVAVRDSFMGPLATGLWLHQLAPDGKIYLSTGNSTYYLHCIDQPDSGGLTCNVLQHEVNLTRFNVTIPNFPNYNLGHLQGSPCDTLQWVGIAEHQHDFKFRIYPNPIVNNSLHIGYQLPQNKSGTFSIYDVTGKVVFKYNLPQWSNTQHFKLPGLSDGVYSCVITSDGYRVGKKMVVIKE